MLITVANTLCSVLDTYQSATHFNNRLPLTIEINEPIDEILNYFVRLEGITVLPWPEIPFLVCCNFCDTQPCGGQYFENTLSLVYGKEKFTRPKVIARMDRFSEVEIQLKAINGETIEPIEKTVIQFSLEAKNR